MPNTVLGWFLTVLLIILATVCIILIIRALGDEGAFAAGVIEWCRNCA